MDDRVWAEAEVVGCVLSSLQSSCLVANGDVPLRDAARVLHMARHWEPKWAHWEHEAENCPRCVRQPEGLQGP